MKALRKIQPHLNAYTFSFDEKLLDEMREAYSSSLLPVLKSFRLESCFRGGEAFHFEIKVKNQKYFLATYGEAPLMWISGNSENTYAMFKRFFDSLNINEEVKKLVDFAKEIRMYCGFFVVGNHLDKEAWHVDYSSGANAYTLLAPLVDLDRSHGHLLYKDAESKIQRYEYKLGEAIIAGDNFLHTTEVYRKTAEPRALVSLTFGTDKLRYWDILKETIGSQSQFMILPCGHQKGSCRCLENYGKTNCLKAARDAVKFAPSKDRKRRAKTPMTIARNTIIVQAKEQVSADLHGEVAILGLKNSVYYGIDAVGPRIWDLIREPKSVENVLNILLEEYDVERDCCEQDLTAFLDKLFQEGLIEIVHE